MKNIMNHTVLLRTRNRHDWLKKALTQYNNFNYQGCLFIVDDSDDLIWLNNSELIKSFKKTLNINHIKGHGASESTRVARVLKSTIYSLKEITTKYYSVSSDDDFIFPDFIIKAISFLDSNNDFSSVIGPEAKLFFNTDGNILFAKRKPWHSCQHLDPLDRALDYASNPTLAYMGVCRTEILNNLSEVSVNIGRECFSRDGVVHFEQYDEEIPWVMLVYIFGKIKYMPYFLMGTRGIHESLDRVERMHKIDSLKGYVLGPIYALTNPSSWQSIRNSHDDLCALIKMKGTKYTDELVSDSVYKIFWHLLRAHNGSGLVSSGVDFFNQNQNSKKYIDRIKRYIYRKINIIFANFAILYKFKNIYFYKKNNKSVL